MRTRLVRRLAAAAGLLLAGLVMTAAPAHAGWEVGSTPDGWEVGGAPDGWEIGGVTW